MTHITLHLIQYILLKCLQSAQSIQSVLFNFQFYALQDECFKNENKHQLYYMSSYN